MRRGVLAFTGLTLVALGLVGCGGFRGEQRAAWRTEAEEACVSRKLVRPSAAIVRIAEIDGPGACGITYPHRISAFADGTVGLTSKVTLGCPIVPVIDGWLLDTVQPAADLYYGTSVAEIRAGSYSCRPRNNQSGAKTSEHAFGNAVDVMSFRFADGRELSVEKGWRGAQTDQDFLREVFLGACRRFTTVLAPGSDVYHYNHFHLDLARHDPRGQRRICKPIIKFEPRLDPDAPVARAAPRPLPAVTRPPSEPAPEIEDDEESVAVSSAAPSQAAAPNRPAPSYATPTASYAAARPVTPAPIQPPPGPVRLPSSRLDAGGPPSRQGGGPIALHRPSPGDADPD